MLWNRDDLGVNSVQVSSYVHKRAHPGDCYYTQKSVEIHQESVETHQSIVGFVDQAKEIESTHMVLGRSADILTDHAERKQISVVKRKPINQRPPQPLDDSTVK